MDDVKLALEGLCNAIAHGDRQLTSTLRQNFVARNWSFVNTIDELAKADERAGDYDNSTKKLRFLEEIAPHISGFFIRRVSASLRAGDNGCLEELALAASRLSNEHEVFHAVEELVANGRPDLAQRLVSDCELRGCFSAGIIAASKSRVLDTMGRVNDAINILDAEYETDHPDIAVLRCKYLLLEKLLCFQLSVEISQRTALQYGAERDLNHAINRLLYLYRFEDCYRTLNEFSVRYIKNTEIADSLKLRVVAAKAAADSAIVEYGSPESVDPIDIFDALSHSGVSASKVLWAKQALVNLIQSHRFTEADYIRFSWFLPNWEEGLIREHILSAARAQFPNAPSVQRGWLHHLVTRGAYGDAARFCETLLSQDVDEDILFLTIALLRLECDGVVFSFMDKELFDSVRSQLLARMPSAGHDFQSVMHDHILALGGSPEPWPVKDLAQPEALPLRRLFAVTTGRLDRVSAHPPLVRGPIIRPVLAISGQLRGFETAWSSIHRHLCQPTGAPVILTVWDKSANATGRHARRLERALPADIITRLKPEERYTDTFEQAYPNTFKLLFGQTDVDAHSLLALVAALACRVVAVETESESLLSRVLPPHVSPNMLKMYYKFARVEQLIQAEEDATGETFSHVIWSRPDCQIIRLAPADLMSCLVKPGIAWSSFTTETSFGDYVMVIPRKAFRALAAIFPRVVTAGDTVLMPWRPNRSSDPRQRTNLSAFGGPDVIFDVLLASGYNPLARIPRMAVNLLGRTPATETVRQIFEAERSTLNSPSS